MSYKRILVSVSMIAFVGALVVGATGAFFSDTETSTGNTFTAGAIDLTIGNSSYYTDENGDVVLNDEGDNSTSWQRGDLDGQLFFNFDDLKPGDIGEDTISIQVDDNDSWACMANNITATPENDQTEPEAIDDDSAGEDSGELQNELMFAVWADDGDNVYEDDERLLNLGDDTPFVSAQELSDQGVQALADSTYSVFADGNAGEPLEGEKEYHLAKAWCLGDMSENPVDQGENNDPTQATGFDCDGASVDNSTQTDGIEGDMEFYAVQSRNNGDFNCETDYTPSWENGDQGDVISTTDEGWPAVTKAWMTSVRFGNNLSESGDWELAIKEDGPSSPWDQEGNEWGSSPTSEMNFELDYDGTTATLTVDGKVVSTNQISGADGKIGIAAKTNADDGIDGKVAISDVKVDGSAPSGPTGFDAQGTESARGLSHMVIDSVSGPFTLTGTFTFEWGSSPNEEGPAFEIHVEDNS